MFAAAVSHAGQLYDVGVSRELAEYRKSTLSNLRYQLRFCIPAERSEAVKGNEVLRFDLKQPREVILDFRADASSVLSVSVNGKIVEYQFKDEHIIIPATATKTGRNQVAVQFVSGDQSLNRSNDYLYTLFVPDRARTAFPCFDQPDLKARYTLTLEVPDKWSAVSNTRVSQKSSDGSITFVESEPLPTYLFAFAAGVFSYQQHTSGSRTIGAYYRETDPRRIDQLPEIFRQIEFSLKWQEEFTGVKYPFAKYDIVILPGFQFGGMEHTGATFYNDNTIFLSANPTPDEMLARANLIAHETSHMWFGDYVTMRWFDDVWTKEVFANYFAAEITAPQFPEINHNLNRLKTYAQSAYSEDRTWTTPLTLANGERILGGGTSIQQPLDNLRNAGLVYNNIIYNKAPLVMYKIVELMGHDAFRKGIREYVRKYAYGNATWDDLIAILDRQTPVDLVAFSRSWVKEKGMPHIRLDYTDATTLTIEQHDPYDRGLRWPQSFDVTLHKGNADSVLHVTLNDADSYVRINVPAGMEGAQILPNTDGRGYGLFLLSRDQLALLRSNWQTITTGTARQAVLMNLHENYLVDNIDTSAWIEMLVEALSHESDPLTASTICAYLREPILRMVELGNSAYIASTNIDTFERMVGVEATLARLAETHPLPSVRTLLVRLLMHVGLTPDTGRWLYRLWDRADNPMLSERDYMALSYELAIRRPEYADDILSRQRERLTEPADGSAPNHDRIREFDFVSRAAAPYRHRLDALFEEMLTPEGRRIEPWAASCIAYLNHPLRERRSVGYILPALNVLEDVQRTGDIFFPATWCRALLGEHTSPEARAVVKEYLETHPDQLPLLRNKVLNGAYGVFR